MPLVNNVVSNTASNHCFEKCRINLALKKFGFFLRFIPCSILHSSCTYAVMTELDKTDK